MLRYSALAAVLILGTIGLGGCGGRTPANNGDGGTILDGPYQLDDSGQIIYDDAGNPVPVQQDAAPGQHDGPITQHDAAVQEDSGSTPGIIQCGQTTCNADTQKCCISGGGGGGTATCIAIADQCQGATIACDGPEDCPTDTPQCCASYGGGGGGSGVTCTADCGNGVLLCRLDTDCGNGEKCCGSGSIRDMSATWCLSEDQCPNTNPTTGVPCGNATCNSPQVCCVGMQSSCTDANQCNQGLPIACDGPEDCSGDTPVCCGTLSMGGDRGTACVADGDCDSSMTGGVICHNNDDCAQGETCQSVPMVSAVRICR